MSKLEHSPLPWTLTWFTKPDGSEIKTQQDIADTVAYSALQCGGTKLWGVTLDDKDEEGRTLVICYTGNGPHSEANARLIVAAINELNGTRMVAASAEEICAECGAQRRAPEHGYDQFADSHRFVSSTTANEAERLGGK